jgi:hypothetical protein
LAIIKHNQKAEAKTEQGLGSKLLSIKQSEEEDKMAPPLLPIS